MRNAFGKGLESLIPKKTAETSGDEETQKEAIFYIETERIKPNPYQPRKEFNQEGLQTLADSIKDHGVLQPLIVSRAEGGAGVSEYQLVAGERRLLASKMAGMNQVPGIIREPTEKEKLEVSLIENVQRMDLNPMEEAEAFKRLQKDFDFTHEAIARMVGKSRVAVTNTMRLLDLPEEIKQAVRDEKINEGHARAILGVKDVAGQKTLFARVLREGLTVREVEDFSQKLNIWRPTTTNKIRLHLHEELKNLENKFKEVLNVKDVFLGINAGKPKLIIFFKSKKEIEQFLQKLNSRK